MRSEVRRYDGNGNLIGTYDVKQVGEMFWASFYQENTDLDFSNGHPIPGYSPKSRRRTVNCEYKDKQGNICGKEFETNSKHARYCSVECRNKAKNKWVKKLGQTLICKRKDCNDTFQQKAANHKYCSDKCKQAARYATFRSKDAESKAGIIKRKLELAKREAQVLRQKHSASSDRDKVGEECTLQAIGA